MLTAQLLLATLLTASGTFAKHLKVNILKFSNRQCDGHPLGMEIKLKENHCVAFTAGSVKILPYKGIFHHNCHVEWYGTSNCEDDRSLVEQQNAAFTEKSQYGECYNIHANAASGRLICKPVPSTLDKSTSATSTSAARTSAAPTIAPRTVSTHAPSNDTLAPRMPKNHLIKVWMKHPFAETQICYDCWSNTENRFDRFECQSNIWTEGCLPAEGPNVPATIIHHSATTSTITATQTKTVDVWPTMAVASSAAESEDPDKRSSISIPQRRHVTLVNPWFREEEVCAKAKWLYEGLPMSKIVIAHTKKKGRRCAGKKNNIQITPEQVTLVQEHHDVATATATAWVSVTHEATPTAAP